MTTAFVLTLIGAALAVGLELFEALAIVLAVGSTRSWRDALIGAAGAVVLLAAVVVVVGPLVLARLPLQPLQVVIGVALLLFGLEWLRKGVLRLAGRRSPSDSFQEYLEEREALEGMEAVPPGQPDWPARIVAGKGVLLEGVEVVLIVAALGAGPDGLAPAIAGAGVAVLLTLAVGFVLHPAADAPARVPPQVRGRDRALVVRRLLPRRGAGHRLARRRRRAPVRGGDAAGGLPGGGRHPRARAGDGLMRALRKLVLGETVALPVGVAIVVAVGLVLREVGGDWWEDDGGFVLLALVVAVLLAALAPALRRR